MGAINIGRLTLGSFSTSMLPRIVRQSFSNLCVIVRIAEILVCISHNSLLC